MPDPAMIAALPISLWLRHFRCPTAGGAHHGGFERRGMCAVIGFVVGQHGSPG